MLGQLSPAPFSRSRQTRRGEPGVHPGSESGWLLGRVVLFRPLSIDAPRVHTACRSCGCLGRDRGRSHPIASATPRQSPGTPTCRHPPPSDLQLHDLRVFDPTESRTTSKALRATAATQRVRVQKGTRSFRAECSRRWGEKPLKGRETQRMASSVTPQVPSAEGRMALATSLGWCGGHTLAVPLFAAKQVGSPLPLSL